MKSEAQENGQSCRFEDLPRNARERDALVLAWRKFTRQLDSRLFETQRERPEIPEAVLIEAIFRETTPDLFSEFVRTSIPQYLLLPGYTLGQYFEHLKLIESALADLSADLPSPSRVILQRVVESSRANLEARTIEKAQSVQGFYEAEERYRELRKKQRTEKAERQARELIAEADRQAREAEESQDQFRRLRAKAHKATQAPKAVNREPPLAAIVRGDGITEHKSSPNPATPVILAVLSELENRDPVDAASSETPTATATALAGGDRKAIAARRERALETYIKIKKQTIKEFAIETLGQSDKSGVQRWKRNAPNTSGAIKQRIETELGFCPDEHELGYWPNAGQSRG